MSLWSGKPITTSCQEPHQTNDKHTTTLRRGSGHALPQFRSVHPEHVHGLGGPPVRLVHNQRQIGMVREDENAQQPETEWVLGDLIDIGGNAAVFEGKVPLNENAVLRFTLFDGKKEREALCDEKRGLRLQHKLQLRDETVGRINRIIDWGVYRFKWNWSKVNPEVSSAVDVDSCPFGVCSVHERCFMDLERWWWDSPLRRTEENARRIVNRAALCLEFLHQEHVIHFDVKLSNFFLPKEDDIDSLQLADFGYARTLDGTSSLPTFVSNEDKTAIAPYESNCMAPELDLFKEGERRRCTTKVDMFSLGMMLLLMATTRLPIHPGTRFRERWQNDDGRGAGEFMKDIDNGNVHGIRRTSFRTNQCEIEPIEWAPWVKESDSKVKSLLERLLDLNPLRRMTASAVRTHEWIEKIQSPPKDTNTCYSTKCIGDFVAIVGCVPQKWC